MNKASEHLLFLENVTLPGKTMQKNGRSDLTKLVPISSLLPSAVLIFLNRIFEDLAHSAQRRWRGNRRHCAALETAVAAAASATTCAPLCLSCLWKGQSLWWTFKILGCETREAPKLTVQRPITLKNQEQTSSFITLLQFHEIFIATTVPCLLF